MYLYLNSSNIELKTYRSKSWHCHSMAFLSRICWHGLHIHLRRPCQRCYFQQQRNRLDSLLAIAPCGEVSINPLSVSYEGDPCHLSNISSSGRASDCTAGDYLTLVGTFLGEIFYLELKQEEEPHF